MSDHCRLVDLIDPGNSKLVDFVTVADVDDEDHVGNCLLQVCELRFCH